jgi:hypothetical protein
MRRPKRSCGASEIKTNFLESRRSAARPLRRRLPARDSLLLRQVAPGFDREAHPRLSRQADGPRPVLVAANVAEPTLLTPLRRAGVTAAQGSYRRDRTGAPVPFLAADRGRQFARYGDNFHYDLRREWSRLAIGLDRIQAKACPTRGAAKVSRRDDAAA